MTVGTALNAARVGQSRSVEELSAITKIRPGIIAAIEADDLDACGGSVYARGHVRALASVLGIDPAPLLAQIGGAPAPAAPVRVPALDPAARVRERRTGSRWTTAAAIVAGIACCLALLRLAVSGGGDDRQHVAAPLPSSTRPSVPVATPRSVAPSKPAGVSLAIEVTGDRCWVWVLDAKGRSKVVRTFNHGEIVTAHDRKRLSVVLGDASAVALTVNGVATETPGTPGGVQRLVLERGKPLQRLPPAPRPSAAPTEQAVAAAVR